jgi:hypothetical protein
VRQRGGGDGARRAQWLQNAQKRRHDSHLVVVDHADLVVRKVLELDGVLLVLVVQLRARAGAPNSKARPSQGDRVGVLLDLDNGLLRFFKNGVQHGPGYPAGSVTGPVVAAVQMVNKDSSVRLLPNAEAPIGN